MAKRVWIITIDLVEESLLGRDPMGVHNKQVVTEEAARKSNGQALDHTFQRMVAAVLRLDRKMNVGEE